MNYWDFNEAVGTISEKLTAFSTILAALADDEKHGAITGYSTLNYLSEAVSDCRNDLLKLTESDSVNTNSN